MKLATMIHILTHGEGLTDDFLATVEARVADINGDDQAALTAAIAAARAKIDPVEEEQATDITAKKPARGAS